MSAKKLAFHEDARDRIRRGVDTLAEADAQRAGGLAGARGME